VSSFKFKVSNYLKKNIFLNELSFSQYKSLLKFLLNDDNNLISEYFENALNSNCSLKELSLFEKILCLLTLRSVCISNILELTVKCSVTNKEYNYSVNLNDIINNLNYFLENNNNTFTKTILYNENFKINLSLPKELYIDQNENVLYKFLESVELNGVLYKNLSIDELDRLPSNIISDIKDFILEAESSLNQFSLLKIKSPFVDSTTNEILFSILNNTAIEFLKIIFKKNLMEIYELEYVLMSKAKVDFKLLDKSTFAENMLYLGLLKNEMEERQKANNTSKSASPQLNIPPIE